MEPTRGVKQQGLTLVGFIFLLAIGAMIAVLVMKLVPTVTEYIGVKKAIVGAKASGSSAIEIRKAFDRQAEVGYISVISGKDLEITQDGGNFEVSFEYQVKIPLFGPASLLLDYSGTTAPATAQKKVP